MDADLVFLPWVRRGAATAVHGPDDFREDRPGLGTATVTLTLNAHRDVDVPVTIMGPGHVTGLDSRQVVRTDPAPYSRSFEPNYFPLVELDEPSLPWLFTPAAPGAEARLRPWLCLAVVRVQDGVRLDPPRLGPLPILRIGPPADATNELPDLAASWAWAHAQVTAPAAASEDDLLRQLVSNPERSIARLLCARVLRPETEYIACVVPAFDLGRKAGLGEPVTGKDEARLAPAWTPDAASVELPVYYSWSFATGAGGDFQSLAMLLGARPLPEGIGIKPIDVSESGLAVPLPAGTELPLGGALRPLGAGEGSWPDPALQDVWEAALAPVLNAPATVTVKEDPLLAPPLYGTAQAGLLQVDRDRPTRWLEQLNLSPVFRATARLGTRVIQEQQDALMASAWAQAAELERVNRLFRQAQFGCWVAESLHRRHIARMEPGVGLQVLAPAATRMARTAPDLADRLFATGLERSAFGAALRRIARPRGAINRRMLRTSKAPSPLPRAASVLFSLQPSRVIGRRLRAPNTPVTFERIVASFRPETLGSKGLIFFTFTWGEATAANIAAKPRRPDFAFVPLGAHVPLTLIGAKHDSDPAALFRSLAQAHLARFNPPPASIPGPGPIRDGQLADAFAEAVARSNPRKSFVLRTLAIVDIPGPDRGEERAFEPVGLSPLFPQPMVEALTEIAQELVLPGLDLVPPNTVVPLETNTAFVEAYLVGLNTEMGRELVWRGFPADLSATYFDRFWNAATAPGRRPDIDPIAAWGDRPLGAAGGAETFVMLIRSELLRRYPNAAIYATKPGAGDRHPIFTGGFAPDLRYVGFDIPAAEIGGWSIVIQEHPSAPRFGVEASDDTSGGAHVPPPEANAALVAKRTRQMPVQITIPASVLLGTA